MSELAAFVLAQLDADEAAARAATPGPWEWVGDSFADQPHSCPHGTEWTDHGPDLVTVAKETTASGSEIPAAHVITSGGYDASDLTIETADAAHIARHDPARVLAEVAAKRAIVEAYLRVVEAGKENARKHAQASNGWPDTQDEIYQLRTHGWQLSGRREGLEVALRALASVFEGAPGWQEEWR